MLMPCGGLSLSLVVAEEAGTGDEAPCDGNGADCTLQSSVAGSEVNEASRLKARVVVLTSMNRTLREELSVYDTLCRSMGVQVQPHRVRSAQGKLG